MSDWHDLDSELERWRDDGRIAEFWWRDDDAHLAGPALDQLLSLSSKTGVPVALAVVPAKIDSSLADALDGVDVEILQHGYAHQNMAAPHEKRSELGLSRPTPYLLADLATGHEQLGARFGDRVLPVLVPPWNRIAPSLVPLLPEIGYRGLSRFAARRRPEPVARLREINAHVDVVDWKRPAGDGRRGDLTDSRPFVGAAAAIQQVIAHLAARRTGRADPDEPTGLLTHHLVHGADAWQFFAELLSFLDRHQSARFRRASQLFAS
ncbi:MAG: hypothetical protein GY791_00080 [Alphaproteobacteria bacterium]|nr:hypothetical protein [Alphaproteobacteria bacterium]